MADSVSITRNGHKTYLKWHRARRRDTDPVFTGQRILEGMALGASVEVDLVVTADKGFAVLHDETLDRETTGTGPVAAASDGYIRRLRLRNNEGHPIDEPVMLLNDLAKLLAQAEPHPDALLQLDYKQDAAALSPAAVGNFAASISPIARHAILSSGDAAAVGMLAGAAPAMRIGYDPCYEGALERLSSSRDFNGFVRDAVAASPKAEMIYLAYEMVLEVMDAGFDIVAAFHAQNRRIDAYTIERADEASAAQAERLLSLRVDQITTDDPEGLFQMLSP